MKIITTIIICFFLCGCSAYYKQYAQKLSEYETLYNNNEITKGEYLLLKEQLEAEKKAEENYARSAYMAMYY